MNGKHLKLQRNLSMQDQNNVDKKGQRIVENINGNKTDYLGNFLWL